MLGTVPGVVRWGVAGALLAFLCVAAFAAVTLPWRGTGDSYFHLDYAYQLSRGQLPDPYGRALQHPGLDVDRTGRQYASAHPPLYYAVAVLAMGSRLAPETWTEAVLAGRALNVALGALTVLVLGWAGWRLGGRHRARLSIATAALGALTVPFVRFSADLYNDLMLAAVSTATLAVTCVVLLRGVTGRRLVLLTVLTTAGMGTKATFVVVLALAVAGVVLAELLHSGSRPARRTVTALGKGLPVGLVPAAAFGWFYLRNARLSGSWSRSTPKVPVGDREPRTVAEVLTDPEFYLVLPGGLLGKNAHRLGPVDAGLLSAVVVLAALVVLVGWLLRGGRWRSLLRVAPLPGAVLVLAGVVVGLYAAQLSHATGYGVYNVRYFLPATLTVGLFLALAATVLGRVSALVVPALMVVLSWGTGTYAVQLVAGRYGPELGGATGWSALAAAAAGNGVAAVWLWVCAGGLVAGALIVGAAMWRAGAGPRPSGRR